APRAPHDVGELVRGRGVLDRGGGVREVAGPVGGARGLGRRRHAPTLPLPSPPDTTRVRRRGTRAPGGGPAAAQDGDRGVLPTLGRGRPGLWRNGRSGGIET